jgi:hypothetical protein
MVINSRSFLTMRAAIVLNTANEAYTGWPLVNIPGTGLSGFLYCGADYTKIESQRYRRHSACVQIAAVYILIKDGVVARVGMSKDLSVRLAVHVSSGRTFDTCLFIPVPTAEWLIPIERRLTKLIRPIDQSPSEQEKADRFDEDKYWARLLYKRRSDFRTALATNSKCTN